jgi:hypothetical protein
MRTLVIPDIHNRIIRAQSIIDKVQHDKLVLTGDYFDNHGEGAYAAEYARATAVWLKEKILYNPTAVALIGNHDSSYIWPENIHFRCSGYTPYKSVAINDVLTNEDKAKFGVYHIDQNHVFSHAGLTNKLWKKYSLNFDETKFASKLEFFDHVLQQETTIALEQANLNNNVELFGAGWERGGYQQYGGINWVDWNTFGPVNGINQIVGHSIHRVPQVLVQHKHGGFVKQDVTEHYKLLDQPNKLDPEYLSVSYNLDTQSNHYAIIEDGVVNIYDCNNNINLRDINNYYIPDSDLNSCF